MFITVQLFEDSSAVPLARRKFVKNIGIPVDGRNCVPIVVPGATVDTNPRNDTEGQHRDTECREAESKIF